MRRANIRSIWRWRYGLSRRWIYRCCQCKPSGITTFRLPSSPIFSMAAPIRRGEDGWKQGAAVISSCWSKTTFVDKRTNYNLTQQRLVIEIDIYITKRYKYFVGWYSHQEKLKVLIMYFIYRDENNINSMSLLCLSCLSLSDNKKAPKKQGPSLG